MSFFVRQQLLKAGDPEPGEWPRNEHGHFTAAGGPDKVKSAAAVDDAAQRLREANNDFIKHAAIFHKARVAHEKAHGAYKVKPEHQPQLKTKAK